MPVATSKSNNVTSNPSAIKFEQDTSPLWSTRQGCGKQRVRFPVPSPLQRSSHSFRVAGVVCFPSGESTELMRLPSKRRYAHYYQQIQHPVALDEIKSRIETEWDANLDWVRQNLELCFKNAKKYNVKDSPTRKDAKHLHVCWRHQPVIDMTRLTPFRNLSTRGTRRRLRGDSAVEAKAGDAPRRQLLFKRRVNWSGQCQPRPISRIIQMRPINDP